MTFNRTIQQLSELIEVKKTRISRHYQVRRFADNSTFVVRPYGLGGWVVTDGPPWDVKPFVWELTEKPVIFCEISAGACLKRIANGLNPVQQMLTGAKS